MKTTRLLLARAAAVLLLAVLTSTVAWADDAKIVVWQNDGNKTEVLFTEMPEFVYSDGNVTLKGSDTELSWPLANLRKFTFESSESMLTDIKDVAATSLDIRSGKCAVYDLNGTLVKATINSLSELPKGVYIVKDGSVTVKAVRK